MLEDFIEAHVRRAWTPGDVDCLLMLADWAMANGYPDAAAHLRGSYCDEAGFRALIEGAGSAVTLVGQCAARIGLCHTECPSPGDIAVIGSARHIHRQFGAIFDGGGWRVRFIDGFPAVTARPLAIWSMACPAR